LALKYPSASILCIGTVTVEWLRHIVQGSAQINREFNQIMATRHNKKWTVAFGCYWVAMFTLVGSDSVRADEPRMSLLSTTGVGTYITTTYPYIETTNDIKKGFSKLYIQAVKDDAAAYLATDSDLDGPMLESAWRAHLEQHKDLQPSKKEFAHMVLATYG
jgi:uncharacterized protein (TIGR02448 family)